MIASDELAALLSGITRAGHDIVPVLEVLKEFEADLSRSFVPLDASLSYFEALARALDVNIGQAQTNLLKKGALAALCRLTENVASRDPSYLLNPAPVVIPWLIDSLGGDSTPNSNDESCEDVNRSLDCMWLACPRPVEEQMREVGLSHSRAAVRLASVNLLSDRISALEGKFAFRKFTPKVAKLLQDPDSNVRNSAYLLLVQVFSAASPAAFADLQRVMRLLRTPEIVQDRLSARIQREQGSSTPGTPLASTPPSQRPSQSSQKSLATTSPLGSPRSPRSPRLGSNSPSGLLSDAAMASSRGTAASPKLPSQARSAKSTDAKPSAPLAPLDVISDPSFAMQDLEVRHIYSEIQFRAEVDQLLPCFSGKESDINWSSRNNALTTFRQLLRNPTSSVSSREKAMALRKMQPSVITALGSLRTVLAVNACHTVKDAFKILGGPTELAEPFLVALSRLAGLNKKMTAALAHVTVSSVLLNLKFSPRLLGVVRSAVLDVKPQLRGYGMVWLQVLILCHGLKSEFVSSQSAEIGSIILKNLQDASPAVRTASRDAFWAMDTQMPASGERVRAKLDSAVLKSLDQARPRSSVSPSVVRESLAFEAGARSSMSSLSPLSSPSERGEHDGSDIAGRSSLSPTPVLSSQMTTSPPLVPKSPSFNTHDSFASQSGAGLASDRNSEPQQLSTDLLMPSQSPVRQSAKSSLNRSPSPLSWEPAQMRPADSSTNLHRISSGPRPSVLSSSTPQSDCKPGESPSLRLSLPPVGSSISSDDSTVRESAPERSVPSGAPSRESLIMGPKAKARASNSLSQMMPSAVSSTLKTPSGSLGRDSAQPQPIRTPALRPTFSSEPPDLSSMHISPESRSLRLNTGAGPVQVYEDPVDSSPFSRNELKDALHIDRSLLTPFPVTEAECLTLFDRLIADLEAAIITESGLMSLIVLVAGRSSSESNDAALSIMETAAMRRWTRAHSGRVASAVSGYLAGSADRANERVHLALVLLSHLITGSLWTQWDASFVDGLIAISQRKYLVTSLEYTALPLVAKSAGKLAMAKVDATSLLKAVENTYFGREQLTRASKVLLLRLALSTSHVVTPSNLLFKAALAEPDACVRREAYPMVLTVYQRDFDAGEAVCSQLTAGQARIVEYYRENSLKV